MWVGRGQRAAGLQGYDVDLLSYGQTGSGKTFTMFGPSFSFFSYQDYHMLLPLIELRLALVSYQDYHTVLLTPAGPPYSMAEAAAAQKKSGAGTGISGDGILRPEHGFVLRSGLDCLAAMQELTARGCKAVLHGSMIEMSILSFSEQNCMDLLKEYTVCFVDDDYHLQGTEHMELRCAADVVQLAARQHDVQYKRVLDYLSRYAIR